MLRHQNCGRAKIGRRLPLYRVNFARRNTDDGRAHARMRAVDAINRRYGRDTVTYAATGTRRAWKLRSEFISPRYSTSWDELLVV